MGLRWILLLGWLVTFFMASTAQNTIFSYASPDKKWQATWSLDANFDTITFSLQTTYNGYIGLGISNTGVMHDSDFVIGWIDSSTGEVQISDRYSDPSSITGEILPLNDTSLGGFDNLFNISGSRETVNGVETTSITFSRKTNTGDKYDTVINDSQLFLLWAYGDVVGSVPQEHVTAGSLSVNYISGKTKGAGLIVGHAVLMILGWALGITPMGILARFYKASIPKWFMIHWMTNTSALILILTAFILIFIEFNGFVPSVHSYLGVLIFSLGLLQAILGQVSNKMYFQGKKPKFWPDKLHWILGYVVISFALFNSFLGFANYFVSVFTYVVYGIYIIVILSFFIFLQVRVGQLHEYANMEEPRPNKTRADVTLLVVFFVVISVILFATLLSAFV